MKTIKKQIKNSWAKQKWKHNTTNLMRHIENSPRGEICSSKYLH